MVGSWENKWNRTEKWLIPPSGFVSCFYVIHEFSSLIWFTGCPLPWCWVFPWQLSEIKCVTMPHFDRITRCFKVFRDKKTFRNCPLDPRTTSWQFAMIQYFYFLFTLALCANFTSIRLPFFLSLTRYFAILASCWIYFYACYFKNPLRLFTAFIRSSCLILTSESPTRCFGADFDYLTPRLFVPLKLGSRKPVWTEQLCNNEASRVAWLISI